MKDKNLVCKTIANKLVACRNAKGYDFFSIDFT